MTDLKRLEEDLDKAKVSPEKKAQALDMARRRIEFSRRIDANRPKPGAPTPTASSHR